MPEKPETIVNLRIPSQLLEKVDFAVKARLLPTSRHAWIMEAIYRQFQNEATEGTLDIFYENHEEPRVTAKYSLRFLRYSATPYGGPLKSMSLVGNDSLEEYLRGLGFNSGAAKEWMKALKTRASVSINNVMMPTSLLGPFGFSLEAGC
jgi:hypothetical protein